MSSPLNFPDSPYPGQVFWGGGSSWSWDGNKWNGNNPNPAGPNYWQVGPGLHLNTATTPPTIDVATPYLPLTGGALATPGNLTIAGTLGVTGATTLAVATATTPATADNSTRVATTAYVQAQGYSTTSYVNSTFLRLSGGTLTGAITFSGAGISPISMNSYSWGWGWDGTVHFYVNGGDQGRLWLESTSGDGWVYKGVNFRASDMQSNNNFSCPGSMITNGVYWQNNGGNAYSPSSFVSGGSLTANNGVVYLAGMYWQNNSGWMYCPWQTRTDGTLQAGGNVVAGNGSGQLGGWGVYTSFIDGNWHQSAAADAFYSYTNAGIAGYCYWSGSDVRMKSNFGVIERDCLNAINAIELQSYDFAEGEPKQQRTNPEETRPEYFRWETLPRQSRHFQSGFVAQQVREIIPEAVPDMRETAYLGVDLRPLVATLIGAVQQLTAKVTLLEAK